MAAAVKKLSISIFFHQSLPQTLHLLLPTPPPAELPHRPIPLPFYRLCPNPSSSLIPIPPPKPCIKSSISSTNLTITLDPCDATPHILKTFALDLQGHKIRSLKSLDFALSSPQSKTLGHKEKPDALKRAKLNFGVNRRRRVDQTIEDFVEAMIIEEESGNGLGFLGECFEWKGMIEEVRTVYEEATEVDGLMDSAREGLKRLKEVAKVGY